MYHFFYSLYFSVDFPVFIIRIHTLKQKTKTKKTKKTYTISSILSILFCLFQHLGHVVFDLYWLLFLLILVTFSIFFTYPLICIICWTLWVKCRDYEFHFFLLKSVGCCSSRQLIWFDYKSKVYLFCEAKSLQFFYSNICSV